MNHTFGLLLLAIQAVANVLFAIQCCDIPAHLLAHRAEVQLLGQRAGETLAWLDFQGTWTNLYSHLQWLTSSPCFISLQTFVWLDSFGQFLLVTAQDCLYVKIKNLWIRVKTILCKGGTILRKILSVLASDGDKAFTSQKKSRPNTNGQYLKKFYNTNASENMDNSYPPQKNNHYKKKEAHRY